MKFFLSLTPLILVLLLNCKGKNAPKTEYTQSNEAQQSMNKTSRQQTGLKISAHLIYDDGTISTFDVLNDKTIALWNVIAGGGDALKPSNSTKVNLNGNIDSINIKIKNGSKLIIDTAIIHLNGDAEYVIKNTGCSEVYINITKSKKVIYNDTIPFHCGE